MKYFKRYSQKQLWIAINGLIGVLFLGIIVVSIRVQQVTHSSAQELPVHSSSVKESLRGTKVALDAKNLEKYLVVEAAILGVSDNISLYFKDINQDKIISIDPTRSWIPASTIKSYVAVEAFRQQRIGLMNLDQVVTIRANNVVTTEMESSEFPVLNEGTQVTIRQLVETMIMQSDNTAYNTLLDLLDRRNINETLHSLGLTETVVGEKLNLDDQQFQEDLIVPGRQPNTTTVKDFAALFDLLQANQIADSDKILAIFKRQKINSMIPAILPPGTIVAHKTGDWAPIYHDGGVVYKPNEPFILALFTNSNDQSVLSRMAKVAYDQNVAAVGASASRSTVKNISQYSLHRYLAEAPTSNAVLGAETATITPQVYIVQKGDTWWSIAEKFYHDGNRWSDITRRNFLPDSTSIHEGMRLIIPSASLTASTSANEKFPKITAADLGVRMSDVTTDVTDASGVKTALIAPGSPLYAVKRFFENQSYHREDTDTAKVDRYLSLCEKRLEEVKAVLAAKKTDGLASLLNDSESDLQHATDIIKANKTLGVKLLDVKRLTDLHYALFASSQNQSSDLANKERTVDAIYAFYTQNQTHIAPVVRSSVAANPIQQQPLIGTVTSVTKNSVQLQFDNGSSRSIPISSTMTVRDFHNTIPDVLPSILTGSKIAVIGESGPGNTVQPLFILRNLPKELPDKRNGTVLDVNPQKSTIEILNRFGQKEEILITDKTVLKGKDTSVSVGGITPGSVITVFGEIQLSAPTNLMKNGSSSARLTVKLTPTISPTSAQLKVTGRHGTINGQSAVTTIVPLITKSIMSPVPSTQAIVPSPTSQAGSGGKEIIIKATSVTVTQNGTGKDVKQETQRTIVPPPPQIKSQSSESKNTPTSHQVAPVPSKTP